jgi:hypothetical protein
LLAFAACDRAPPAPERSTPVTPRPSVENALPSREGAERARLPAPERLVAIGDLHGDLQATKEVLRLAGAIDESDHWVGGALVVVQTGDQIDRGDDDRAILDLLDRLGDEAEQSGGALHVLNGNHETMNAAGDFRYVTDPSFSAFAGADARKLPGAVERLLPESQRPRAQAFLPGGRYATLLAERKVVLIVGDSVFVHGGVLPEHVDHGIDRINDEVNAWLRGEAGMPKIIASDDAPVWTRLYSQGTPSAAACRTLERVLSRLLVQRMVVGHTVQEDGITSACDDRVWRIDVGMSRYYQGASVSALEIGKEGVRVLTRPKGGSAAVPSAAAPSTAAPSAAE